jgi:hypothetical protein
VAVGSSVKLAHFVIRPDLDLWNHNTHDSADVSITFVIGLKRDVGLSLGFARPPDLKPATLKNRTPDFKMSTHIRQFGFYGTTLFIW